MSNLTLAVKFTNLHSVDSKYFIWLRNTDFEGMHKANELCQNELNFLPNPGPLSFGLGPKSFYFRGPACSWRKNVRLYPCSI